MKTLVDKYSTELAQVLKYNPELLQNTNDLELVLSIRLQQLVNEYEATRQEQRIAITDLIGVEAFRDVQKGIN